MTATVVRLHLIGSDDIFFQLLVVSSYVVISSTVLPSSSLPPIMTGGEVFGTRAVNQYDVSASSCHLVLSSCVDELVKDC